MRTAAIITAAGEGKRMGRPKQFIEINGKAVLEWTLAAFQKAEAVDAIVLVVNAEEIENARKFKFPKIKQIVAGGKERQDSVRNGLNALPADTEIVVIHDGARPMITGEIIRRAVAEAEKHGAVVVGVPLTDTIKMTNEGTIILKTLDRSNLWAAQTPQVFKKELVLRAFKEGAGKHKVTDDAMLVEKLGVPVKMVMGSYRNIKITTPEELGIAEKYLREGEQE